MWLKWLKWGYKPVITVFWAKTCVQKPHFKWIAMDDQQFSKKSKRGSTLTLISEFVPKNWSVNTSNTNYRQQTLRENMYKYVNISSVIIRLWFLTFKNPVQHLCLSLQDPPWHVRKSKRHEMFKFNSCWHFTYKSIIYTVSWIILT